MAQGQGNRALESSDGSPVEVKRGEVQTGAPTTEELLVALLNEVKELKVLLRMAIG